MDYEATEMRGLGLICIINHCLYDCMIAWSRAFGDVVGGSGYGGVDVDGKDQRRGCSSGGVLFPVSAEPSTLARVRD